MDIGSAARPGMDQREAGPLTELRRWVAGGGLWRLRGRTAAGVEVALLTCSAAEEMGRLVFPDETVLAGVPGCADD